MKSLNLNLLRAQSGVKPPPSKAPLAQPIKDFTKKQGRHILDVAPLRWLPATSYRLLFFQRSHGMGDEQFLIFLEAQDLGYFFKADQGEDA